MPMINCVFFGDENIGKTCMINRFVTKAYKEDVPTAFEFLSDFIVCDGDFYELIFWDTPGEESYDFQRFDMYPEQDVFLICFSVVQRNSFNHVYDKWYPEVRKHHSSIPIILVGTQVDIRDKPRKEGHSKSSDLSVSQQEGLEMAQKIGALKYVECSSVTGEGVNTVFNEVIPLYLQAQVDKEKAREEKKSEHK